ncbi:MAG: restriction endonuclease subunit S [Bradyrhizobiaceae bacterium]|nr:MAG: restriction endonuclease subunit S [Bradyrhizobiaceae bacterium]
MNAEQLLAQYERISDAPNAIAQLRRFVLDLAVRGKLVPQDPREEPQISALKRARERLETAASNTGRLRWKASVPVDTSEVRKDIPSGWVAARVNDTGLYVNGLAFKPSDWKKKGLPIIRIQNLTDPDRQFNFAEGNFPDEVLVRDGDLLVSWSATLEAFKWERGHGVLNQHIFRVIPDNGLTIRDFLLLLLQNAIREMADGEHAHGLVMTHINREPFVSHVVLIPPLAEQNRIVAKVAELMALCTGLEAARSERESTRERLTAASLARLNAPDPVTFSDDARFAINALPALTTRTDQLKQLRQTILNLAVRGKLVPQDPNDEPAQNALQAIRAERDELIRLKSIRREGPLKPVREDEQSFGIPMTWVWVRIGDAALFTQYGTSARAMPSQHGTPVLTMSNVQDGLVVWGNEKRISDDSDELPDLFLKKFDLLYNRTNSAELVGKTGIYLGENDCRTFASYLIRLRLSLAHSSPRYVNLAMNAPVFRETQIVPLIKKQTGQANVNGTALKNMLIPFPPLAEQHRIVAKVDELVALCKHFEASLTTADTTRSRLLEALLAAALSPIKGCKLEAAE